MMRKPSQLPLMTTWRRAALICAMALVSLPAFAQQPAQPNEIPAWQKSRGGAILPIPDEHAVPATPPPAGLYVAMGDSITFGVGVSKNCQAFPTHPVDIEEYCPDGTSYPIHVAKALRAAGVAGHFMNLGIGGAHVERVISDELPYLPANATLVTLYIGTNDSRAVRSPNTTIEDVVKKFEDHFDQLLGMIHARAPQARIVLINFPNEKYLAATYHVTPDVVARYNISSQILDRFIDNHAPQYAVVDTTCNPASYQDSLLYKGGVHPNDAGAEILAQSVLKVVLDRNPAQPPSQCTWFNAEEAAHLAAQWASGSSPAEPK